MLDPEEEGPTPGSSMVHSVNSPNKKKAKDVREVTDKVTNVNPDHLIQHIKT